MNVETMDGISGELALVIASYIKENHLKIGKDIFFLISADANHYGKDFDNIPYGEDEKAHALATTRDQKIAGTFHQVIRRMSGREVVTAIIREMR